MIVRWLQTAVSLFVYFCAATLLAQVIILAYLWSTWQLDRDKVVQMLAVAQGIDLFAAQKQDQFSLEQVAPEQPSYQDWIQRRATMFRDLELRELALENALSQLKSQERQLADDQQENEQLMADFQARLLTLRQGAEAEGMETVGRILETLKPKQAKEQILEMLSNDETDEVVLLLNGMTDSKRAKILAEFETPEENAKISEVLRLIREGKPVASLTEETLGQLPNSNQTTSTQ